jgi:hypothetical protein
VAPATPRKRGASVKGLISALIGIALVPMAILFALLWQDMMRLRGTQTVAPAKQMSAVRTFDQSASTEPKQAARLFEVALSSPGRIDAEAGDVVEFPIAIDATAALPARSIVAITALPEGASFSAGRPFGVSGWSLRPDEIGDLQLRLPPRTANSDMRLELVAGDGTVLAQSETRLSIATLPPVVATVDHPMLDAAQTTPTNTAALEQIAVAQAEEIAPLADTPPPPQRKPTASSENDSALKVNTVKVVTITPPLPARPHDGAYALGSPADEATAEWMETKTAVDMHVKAQQSSETVKVAEKGLKVRVTARDKNWVQVTDPASSTTGWIYNRFLQPAKPPAQ